MTQDDNFTGEVKHLDISTVLASTVHDVKNSLGLINSELESIMLALAEEHPEQADQLKRVLLESNRINSGLSHMLGLYRIENGMLHPSLEEVLVLDVLEDTASRYSSTINRSAITMALDVPGDDLTWVLDPALVHHILSNILTNAIRYTRDRIVLRAWVENDELCIAIDDNGSGYPEALLNCLEPDTSMEVKASSTGLGIYFADRIARLHVNEHTGKTGSIELINQPDDSRSGARFLLRLP